MLAPPSMQDLAAELGLSRLTVSSVVNGRARRLGISTATVARVTEHLQQRGYVPSRSAVALQSGARERIGILCAGPLYSHLTEAFNRFTGAFHASPKGLEIAIVPHADLVRGFQELLGRGVSRLLWIQSRTAREEFADPRLFPYARHLRTVVYNFYFEAGDAADELIRKGFHLIGVERLKGYAQLGRALKGLGHAVVALPDRTPEPERVEVRAAGLRQAGLQVRFSCPPGVSTGSRPRYIQAMADGLERVMRQERVTAAVFHDDELAALTLTELLRRGVRVPEELSVTGFDGLPLAEAFRVPLTTLRIPIARMVGLAQRLLEKSEAPRRHCLPLELVLGGSHGKARHVVRSS